MKQKVNTHIENGIIRTAIIEIEKKTIESVEMQIQDAIYHFNTLNRSVKDIKIYMPEYFNRMFSYHTIMPPQHIKITSYRGIDVVDGYENKVIVSVKNNVIYSIAPVEIEL